jgi:YjbE family integral membrane protein
VTAMNTGHFLLNGLRIVVIDLLLAGDNALVIALAVRSLPRKERRIGIACGAALAVLLRVALTVVAARLLTIEYLKLAGGLFVLWIAWRVLADVSEPPDSTPAPKRLLQAIWYVVFADLTMSTDNILAIAGASAGHFGLILFGLALSIPFVVFSSNLLADLMSRFPVTIYIGVAILGQVAADMVLTDPALVRSFHPSAALRFGIEAMVVAALLIAGRLRARRQTR